MSKTDNSFFKNLKFQNQTPYIDEADIEHFDSGFGQKFTNKMRLVNDDGSFNIERKGGRRSMYEWMLEIHWIGFFAILMGAYIVCNAIFAVLFWINGIDEIFGIYPSTLVEELYHCFFFIVQTFTTLGYGRIGPIGIGANIIASLNAFAGLLTFALATGLFFARFSKPTSSIKFSNNILMTPFANEFQSIQLRIINGSHTKMTDMQARLLFTWLEQEDGKFRRKFERLDLFIDSIYLFPLNWTIVHVIDKDSPLNGKSKEWYAERNAELILIVKGFDDTYSQFITDYRGYDLNKLIVNARFKTMYMIKKEKTILDMSLLDSYELISEEQ